MMGAETTTPSTTIARGRPTLRAVNSSNARAGAGAREIAAETWVAASMLATTVSTVSMSQVDTTGAGASATGVPVRRGKRRFGCCPSARGWSAKTDVVLRPASAGARAGKGPTEQGAVTGCDVLAMALVSRGDAAVQEVSKSKATCRAVAIDLTRFCMDLANCEYVITTNCDGYLSGKYFMKKSYPCRPMALRSKSNEPRSSSVSSCSIL